MNPPILHINYKFNDDILIKKFNQYKDLYNYFVVKNLTTPKNPDGESYSRTIDGYKVIFSDGKRDNELDEIGNIFCNYYSIPYRWFLSYLYLEPYAILPWHTDAKQHTTAINHVLTPDAVGITYENGIYNYKTALLNVKLNHMVANNDKHRIVFRFTFLDPDATYDTLYNIIYAVDNNDR